MKRILIATCFFLAPAIAPAQLKLDHLDRLAAKASETVNLTLDGSLLQMAAKFLDDDSDSASVKKLVSGLKGIQIRSFEFKNAGEYQPDDVDAIRNQLRDPDWKRIVQTRSKAEGDSDIYLKTEGGRITGLAIISAEPKELTIVSIDGVIDEAGMRKLAGNFGIPSHLGKAPTSKKSKEKDE